MLRRQTMTLFGRLAVVLLLFTLAATAANTVAAKSRTSRSTARRWRITASAIADRAGGHLSSAELREEHQRYPVLYLLHGYTGDERGWMNPSYVGFPEMMDSLIRKNMRSRR